MSNFRFIVSQYISFFELFHLYHLHARKSLRVVDESEPRGFSIYQHYADEKLEIILTNTQITRVNNDIHIGSSLMK